MTIGRLLIWIGNTLANGHETMRWLPATDLSTKVNDLSMRDAKRLRTILKQVISELEL
jgi:hypothetical protein